MPRSARRHVRSIWELPLFTHSLLSLTHSLTHPFIHSIHSSLPPSFPSLFMVPFLPPPPSLRALLREVLAAPALAALTASCQRLRSLRAGYATAASAKASSSLPAPRLSYEILFDLIFIRILFIVLVVLQIVVLLVITAFLFLTSSSSSFYLTELVMPCEHIDDSAFSSWRPRPSSAAPFGASTSPTAEESLPKASLP